MATLTRLYTHDGGGYEAIYIDGLKEYGNHMGRVWPDRMMSILSDYEITETENIEVSFGTDEKGRMLATTYPRQLDDVYDAEDYVVEDG
jgi:hypothetical protein